jgi:hypothetical protein
MCGQVPNLTTSRRPTYMVGLSRYCTYTGVNSNGLHYRQGSEPLSEGGARRARPLDDGDGVML